MNILKPEIHALVANMLHEGGPEVTLKDAALGCRSAGFSPLECAPHLFLQFPSTAANDMAAVLVEVWIGEVSNDSLTAAMQACLTESEARAYTDQEISDAVGNNISLTWLADKVIQSGLNKKVMGLYEGDLTNLKPAEGVNILVVSSLPDDYSPVSGSLIGSLSKKGISVADLAQNKAKDYEPGKPCWISQPITNPQAGIAFDQILLYEPADPSADSAAHMPDIFAAIQDFIGNNTTKVNVAMPMVSTGSGQANPNDILTAIYNAAKTTMESDFILNGLCIVVYESAMAAQMLTLFNELKNQ